MADFQDLLIEIGTEEMPPKALLQLSRSFSRSVQDELSQHQVEHGRVHRFATPRRLALLIERVAAAQPQRRFERRGPSLAASFDTAGSPTKAALGFAGSCGVPVNQLERLETAKGSWLVHRYEEGGKRTVELVPGVVTKALESLPVPKRMRWGQGDEEFVRPVHWVVLLFGSSVIDADVLGIRAGRDTRGHRFHHPAPLRLLSAAEYQTRLREEGMVIPSFEERRTVVRQQVEDLAGEIGAEALIGGELLDEVTALVEWPQSILGSYEEKFLGVPAEALIEAMQRHQKYFALVDPSDGRLLPRFIAVSNIASRDPDQIRSGNERVIRPRFSDAAFFWTQDKRHPLEHFLPGLKGVVFQSELGTLYEKTERVKVLCDSIAKALGTDSTEAVRSAVLSKCDLLSSMVREFPSLQGIMGRYYAGSWGEPSAVCQALQEQYMPRHAGDLLPQGRCGQILSIADKLDTVVGIFAIGQRPSGVKDPFGLRRASLGVLRILIETPLELDLEWLLHQTAQGLSAKTNADSAVEGVFEYMMERLRGYYADRGFRPDEVDAVLARKPTMPMDLDQRVHALKQFRTLPEAESLSGANKRIRNILRQQESAVAKLDPGLFSDSAEKALYDHLRVLGDEVEALFAQGQYETGLSRLAVLREPVDRFFDQVMVMSENEQVRGNRLALLSGVEQLFLRVADFSRLQ